MARSTWGSIRAKSKGIWELRYDISAKDKRVQRSETVRGTKAKAERRLAELRVEHEGIGPDATLSQFWDDVYWPSCEELAPATKVSYKRSYNHAIKPAFGDMPLRKIGPKAIQRWIDGMTYGAARNSRAVLRSILSRAVTEELVESNAAMARFRLPRKKPENMKVRVNDGVFDKNELDIVFQNCTGEAFEAPFILAAFGGARREEACGVRACEVEFEELDESGLFAVVPIVRGVQHLDGEIVIVDVKTPESERWLVIPPPYAQRLQELCGDVEGRGEEWLIEDGFGNLMSPNTMSMAYKRWFLGRPYRYVPFSNLRNSYATVMHALGVDLEMVQKLMGHTQLSTTFKHYDRPGRKEFVKVVSDAVRNAGVVG